MFPSGILNHEFSLPNPETYTDLPGFPCQVPVLERQLQEKQQEMESQARGYGYCRSKDSTTYIHVAQRGGFLGIAVWRTRNGASYTPAIRLWASSCR